MSLFGSAAGSGRTVRMAEPGGNAAIRQVRAAALNASYVAVSGGMDPSFLMMGLAAWQVWRQPLRPRLALPVYGVQLFFNFFWSLLFFRWGLFFPALLWLAALWVLILWTLLLFRKTRASAGWLLVPYLLWVSFAAYLNAGVWLLN